MLLRLKYLYPEARNEVVLGGSWRCTAATNGRIEGLFRPCVHEAEGSDDSM